MINSLARATVAATAAAALLVPASALASHNITAPVSLDSAGVIGNDHSEHSDITPDARFVAFASHASNLVPGDTNGVGDVFVRDRRYGITERVSVGLKGEEADGDSNFLGIASNAAISDDGRYVAFKSSATNLVRGDNNDATDVFVYDRLADTTELVSVDSDGQAAAGGGDDPAMSADGRYVAFTTGDFDEDFATDVYLRDRVAGTTQRISVSHDGSEVFGVSDTPAVALGEGGPIVAFVSGAGNLVPEDTDSNTDVFVRDLSGPTPFTERVSVSSTEESAGCCAPSRWPAVSADGRYVAFSSNAQNFTDPPQTRFNADVFVRDRVDGVTELISHNTSGGEAGGTSEIPDISPDGRFVSFGSFAPDLVENKTDNSLLRDAYVHDRALGMNELVSVASDHSNAMFGSFDTHVNAGAVSGDGLVSLMHTNADNLFAGDDNFSRDVFANDRRPPADLALAMSDAPDPASPKSIVTYTLSVTNEGPSSAPDAGVLDTLPADMTFVAASPGCTNSGGTVECELGTLAPGQSATVTIEVETKPRGVFTNTAVTGSLVSDPDAADNRATVDTTVAK